MSKLVLITINGETKCVIDWCRHFGMNKASYYYRVNAKGLTPELALTTPIDESRRYWRKPGRHVWKTVKK